MRSSEIGPRILFLLMGSTIMALHAGDRRYTTEVPHDELGWSPPVRFFDIEAHVVYHSSPRQSSPVPPRSGAVAVPDIQDAKSDTDEAAELKVATVAGSPSKMLSGFNPFAVLAASAVPPDDMELEAPVTPHPEKVASSQCTLDLLTREIREDPFFLNRALRNLPNGHKALAALLAAGAKTSSVAVQVSDGQEGKRSRSGSNASHVHPARCISPSKPLGRQSSCS